jgi:hypothetical protein
VVARRVARARRRRRGVARHPAVLGHRHNMSSSSRGRLRRGFGAGAGASAGVE